MRDVLNARCSFFAAAVVVYLLIMPAAVPAAQANVPEVLLMLDDIGMEHSVDEALEDVARTGMPMMPRHRQAELDASLSPEVGALVKSGKIRLINYAQLVERGGLDAMRRPQ